MDNIISKKHKQTEIVETEGNKRCKQDAGEPVVLLPQGPHQPVTVSELAREAAFDLGLLGVPKGPVISSFEPDSVAFGPGSLDSTDWNVLPSTAGALPASRSPARVGGSGAFSGISAAPLCFSDAAGASESPAAAAAPAAAAQPAAAAPGHVSAVFEMLLKAPSDQQQQALEDVASLQQQQRISVVLGSEQQRKHKSYGHKYVARHAFIVFEPSVASLAGCSNEDVQKLLGASNFVESSWSPQRFHHEFAARKAECQQTGGEKKLLVVKCIQKILMHPSVENPQRQLVDTTNVAEMQRLSKQLKEWGEVDAGERKLALDLLVAAAVQVALGAGVPPDMPLFAMTAQPRQKVAATSTFNNMMQQLGTE